MSNYFKSEKHLENARKASVLGNIKIQEIKKKRIEKYYLNPKLCLNCQTPLDYYKKSNTFCNSSCAGTYNNKNRDTSFITEEFREKAREYAIKGFENKLKKENRENVYNVDILCPECGKSLSKEQKMRKRTYCSNSCRAKNVKEETKEKIRKTKLESVKNGTHKGWQSRKILSYPEKFFINVLKSNDIKYEPNFPLKKREIGVEEDGNYFLDFYIENKKIDLEIDGKQHNYKERKESDIKRDSLLTNHGMKVYRIKWKNPNNDKNKGYIENQIRNFLKFYETQ